MTELTTVHIVNGLLFSTRKKLSRKPERTWKKLQFVLIEVNSKRPYRDGLILVLFSPRSQWAGTKSDILEKEKRQKWKY